MSKLSPQRRRIVVMAGSVACIAGVVPTLLKEHPVLRMVLLAFMVAALVYVVVEVVRLKRSEG
jgi:energy-converting hydrogenase Eha subunit C